MKSQKVVAVTEALARWYRRDNLRRLLRLKLFTEQGNLVDPQTEKMYSLERLDVNKLLQVSPLTRPTPAAPVEPPPANLQAGAA